MKWMIPFLLSLSCMGQPVTLNDRAFAGQQSLAASLTTPTFVRSFSNSSSAASCTVSSVNCSGGNMLVIHGAWKVATIKAISSITFGGTGCASQFVTNFISSGAGKVFTYTTNTSATADVVVTLNGTPTSLIVICDIYNNVGSVGNAAGFFITSATTLATSLPPGGISSDVIDECFAYLTTSGIVETDNSFVQGFVTNAVATLPGLFSGHTNGTASAVRGTASGAGAILGQSAIILHGM